MVLGSGTILIWFGAAVNAGLLTPLELSFDPIQLSDHTLVHLSRAKAQARAQAQAKILLIVILGSTF